MTSQLLRLSGALFKNFRPTMPGGSFLLANVVVNITNFGFHISMSRMLGPSDYGAFGSLLGLVTVAVVPITAMQAAVAQAVAGSDRSLTWSRGSLGKPFAKSLVAAFLVLILGVLLAPFADSFWHFRSSTPVVLLTLYLALNVVMIVPQGALLGRLRYGTVALATVSNGVARFAAGSLLVYSGIHISGAVAASTIGSLVGFAILVFPVREALLGFRSPSELSLTLRTVSLSIVATAGIPAYLGIDSVLARHYLSSISSGYYVAATTAGRAALFFPASVALVVFPQFTAAHDDPDKLRLILRTSLAVVVLLGAATALFSLLFPRLLITALFGHSYIAAAPIVRILAVAAAAMGVATLLIYYHLARRSIVSMATWLGFGLIIGLVVAHHTAPAAIAWITLLATLLVTLLLLFMAHSRLTCRCRSQRHERPCSADNTHSPALATYSDPEDLS